MAKLTILCYDQIPTSLQSNNPFDQMQICLLTKRKIGNWHIYGQAYHFLLRTAMVFLNTSGKDWQLAAIPKIPLEGLYLLSAKCDIVCHWILEFLKWQQCHLPVMVFCFVVLIYLNVLQ